MFFLAYGEWQHWCCGSSPSGYGVATAGLLQQFSVSQRLLRELAQRPQPSKMKKQFIAVLFSALLCFPAHSITSEQTAQLGAIVLGIGLGSFLIYKVKTATPVLEIAINTSQYSQSLEPWFKLPHRYYLSAFLRRMLKRIENKVDELSNHTPLYSQKDLYEADDAADQVIAVNSNNFSFFFNFKLGY